MTRPRKKRAPRRRTSTSVHAADALAVRAPPPVAVDPSGAYVRVPLPPEILAAVGEYVDHGQRLFAILSSANASAEEFAEACKRAAVTVARDVARLKKRRR